MKLLRRQPGLPFLMALGLLLILSASFLAVQLWSDGSTRRGAVQALEAPVMPRALDAKKGSKTKVAARPVKKLPVEEPMVEEKAVELPAVNETAVVENSGELPDVVVSVPEPEKVIPEIKEEVKPAKKADVKPVAPVIKPKAEKKAAVSRPAKAPRKSRPVVEEDITVMPPEWNWFSTPLKAELKHGQVNIVAAVAPVDVKLVTVAARTVERKEPEKAQPAVDTQIAAPSKSEPVIDGQKPFSKALERMAKIRRIRETREVKVAPEEAKQVAVVDEVSPSMRKLGETLRKLSEKLEKAPASSFERSYQAPVAAAVAPTAAFEEAPAVKAAGGSEELESAELNSQLKPFYGGSGSSFSNRLNEMIRRGDWLRE